ncbi:zeta toxin family protein [Streptomyces sp. NPDC048430]|uniref:zeta toxin family protein n=1 Tax=Streptomyces sp. NPDC048430 TaxID=3155388 RepID=UPI003439E06A
MNDEDAVPVVLPADEHGKILRSQILPLWAGRAVTQTWPVVLLIAGPPGSGKSTACEVLKAALDRRGGSVLIGRDLYKPAHPAYEHLLRCDDRTAGVRVRPDVLRWQAEVEEYVRSQRMDAVVETPVADPDQVRPYLRSGYRVEVLVIAEPKAVTELSTLDRYLRQVAEAGVGRFVSWGNQDACRARLPESLRVIEHEQLAHRVTVARRDLQVLYTREHASPAPPGAHLALLAEQGRSWTAPETWGFRRQVSNLEQRLHPSVSTRERRLAVTGGIDRVQALAEPVRRSAQPLSAPPGVDYHRLSADEHDFIFDELIVPMHLSSITAHDRPVALYVVGAQGAGKSHAARLLRRVLGERRPTRIEGGMFKAMHPDYRRLLEEEPRTASSRIRRDYRRWQERAEAYVRARRGDLLIEMAPDNVDHFLDSARRTRHDGYRVELLVLGVRTADSRLGTASRCAEVARLGGSPRFTQGAAHQRSSAVLTDVVRAAEETPHVVESVSIVRRDLTAVYRNHRTVGGGWLRPPQGADVVEQELVRPYTTQEALWFLNTVQRLQGEMPQYRDDLVQIAAQARGLMPGYLRPRALACVVPVAALPVLSRQGIGHWSLNSLSRAV